MPEHNATTTPSIDERWTADITVADWKQHDHQLAGEGYIPVAPARAADIDKPIAELTICPRCRKTMKYRPRFRQEPRTYRPFAVCESCNVAAEF